MFRRAILLSVGLLVFVIIVFLVSRAWAGMVCGNQKSFFDVLEKGHGEQKIAQGVTKRKELLIVFRHPETREFSIVLVYAVPYPHACILRVGEGWEAITQSIGPEL